MASVLATDRDRSRPSDITSTPAGVPAGAANLTSGICRFFTITGPESTHLRCHHAHTFDHDRDRNGKWEDVMDAKEIVLAAAKELFGDKDATAVDRWVARDYKQHSTLAPDGPEGLRGLVATAPEGFRYEGARVIADGDLVAMHGMYHGVAPQPLVAFDLFRV